MIKLKLMFLSFSCLVIGSFSASVPFIDKCKWDDKPCLKTSSQKAIPYAAAGVPELGSPPMDPLVIDKITYNGGGLNIVFTNTKITGTSKCQVVDIERNKDEAWLKFEAECPIDVHGQYEVSGKLLAIDITGNGPFHVQSDKVFVAVKVGLNTIDGADGEKYWDINNPEYKFEFKDKAHLKFENLFGGDHSKADPIENILDNQWNEVVHDVGAPIVNEFLNHVLGIVKIMTKAVPAKELEIL